HPMPPEQNLADLRRHAEDFANRTGFTYTVLASDDGSVIGCVYIYPSDVAGVAAVRSWVRADRAGLDVPVHDAVAAWLADVWPFTAVRYAPRSDCQRLLYLWRSGNWMAIGDRQALTKIVSGY